MLRQMAMPDLDESVKVPVLAEHPFLLPAVHASCMQACLKAPCVHDACALP
jgi:hypothetical protein